MGVIGGYFGGASERCNGAALTEISRSTAVLGGRREAFIKGRIGLAVGLERCEDKLSGLYFFEDGGEAFAAAACGGLLESDALMLLRTYAEKKSLCGCPFSGAFSAAVCDGRDELYIFRFGEDAPPLYYAVIDGDFAFCSCVKGLSGFLGGCFVRAEILREHLLSWAGRYRAEDLYRGIYGVECGSGMRFTPTGISSFALDRAVGDHHCAEAVATHGEFVCPDCDKMRELLREILLAFDYPQFDAFMPTFLRDVRSGGLVVDHSLCMDTRYASERRARLFSARGRRAQTAPPITQGYGERELSRMYEVLRELLAADEHEVYGLVLGGSWRSVIEKEKNTARRIRMCGMLWQTAFWYERYNVILI